MGTGVGTAAAAAGSVAAGVATGVATGRALAGGTVVAGVAAAGLTVAAGTATGVAVTGTAGSATGVVVAVGTNVPPITEAGVAAGLAAAVLAGTGVTSAAGVRGGARSEDDAIVAGAAVTEEAVAGDIVREAGGGEGLLPMPNVSKRPPKKPSGGNGGMYPGCALVGWLDSRMVTRQRSRAGCKCTILHLCCALPPLLLQLVPAPIAVLMPRLLRCGFSEI